MRTRTRNPRLHVELLEDRCTPSVVLVEALSLPFAPVRPANEFAAAHVRALVAQQDAEDLTLTLTVDLEAETRTWTATGAIEDSGTATTVRIQFGAFGAPTKSVLLIDTLFANADGTGTFTIRRTIISTANGPDQWVREGAWHVVDATGIYAGLRGHGKLTGTEMGTLVEDTLTGVLMKR